MVGSQADLSNLLSMNQRSFKLLSLSVLLFSCIFFVCAFNSFGQEDFSQLIPIGDFKGTSGTYSPLAIDVDLDGDDDLMVLQHENLYWLERLEDDLWVPHELLHGFGFNGALKLADFDQDGIDDIFWWSLESAGWISYQGNGMTEGVHVIEENLSNARTAEIGDIDSDGWLDVVIATETGMKVFMNNGEGELVFETTIETPFYQAHTLRIVDIDDDGHKDLVFLSYDRLAWLKNDGNNVFDLYDLIWNVDFDGYRDNLEVFDWDGNGLVDIISGTWEGSLIFYNSGEGEFQSPISFGPGSMFTLSDVTGDEMEELISTASPIYEQPSNNVFIHSQDNEEVVVVDNYSSFELGLNKPLSGDFDGDGDNDLVASMRNENGIVYYANQGDGSFGQVNYITNKSDSHKHQSTDIDNDGDVDIISISPEFQNAGNLFWRENDGNGKFFSGKYVGTDISVNEGFVLADLTGNDLPDLVFSSAENYSVFWAENLGGGSFSEPTLIYSYFGNLDLSTGDLNGDGWEDVFILNKDTDSQFWFENNGDGSISTSLINDASTTSNFAPTFADMDGDGDLDLVQASFEDDILYLRENDGSGNFGENITVASVDGPQLYDLGDYDNDGDLDVVIWANENTQLYILKNEGMFSFVLAPYTPLIGSPSAPTFADLDGDGDLDIVTGNSEGLESVFVWVENLGNDVFINHVLPEVLRGREYSVADLDLDGSIDVISSVWESTGTYEDVFWMKNEIGLGCTNPSACNFNPEATVDNGACCFGICGCADPTASNFAAEVDCPEGGVCNYPITGLVFNDLDEDALWNNDDYPLAGISVVLEPSGMVAITDDFGAFSFANIPEGPYTVEVLTSENFPYSTTINPVDYMNESESSSVIIGISQEAIEIETTAALFGPITVSCSASEVYQASVTNLGNVAIDVVIELEISPLFYNIIESNLMDSIAEPFIYFSLEGLLPGVSENFPFTLITPSAELLGTSLDNTINVTAYLNGEEVGESFSSSQSSIVACAYDPNDKQVFPEGYEDPHYVLPESQLDYLIRFQNTGNAPANHVEIHDTISPFLDLSTFQLDAYSHSVQTTINSQNRVVSFIFEEINLPDSICCEEASHGFVSYSMIPFSGLEPETRIENMAQIFFDNNPAISTNTTWTTIYECTNELAAFELTSDPICYGTAVEAMNNGMYIEEYSWTLDGDEVGTEADLLLEGLESGTSTLELTVSNPLCVANASSTFTVLNELEVFIQQNGNQLYYAGFESGDFQWYLNGEAIEGATEQSIEITEDGTYHLELINTQGCIGVSGDLDVIFDSISELGIPGVNVYPNPVQDILTIEFSDASPRTIELYSEDGKLIQSQMVNTSTYYLDMQELASGVYTLSVVGEGSVRVMR